MHSSPSDASCDDRDYPNDFSDAFRQAQQAVTDARRAAHHVWHLEFVLAALLRAKRPAEISFDDRDDLTRNLIAARDVSLRLLTDRYATEQIEYGYRAACHIVARWAVPLDERAAYAGSTVSDVVLKMFHFDVVNMRRRASLVRKMDGKSFDELLPPLPTPREPDRCQVIPFPRPAREETI